jgi:hypothetical protein
MYTQAFERLYLANKIRRDSAIRILKMWNFLSCLAGADVTLGVADHVRQRFDVSPLEMDEPVRMLQDPPPHVRYVLSPLFHRPFVPLLCLQLGYTGKETKSKPSNQRGLPSPPHPPLLLLHHGPNSLQRLRQYQASEAKIARTQQLKEMEVFKQADEGSDVTKASVLMFVTTESTMWAACNDIHANRLKEATELWDKALQRKLTWAYLMAPVYAPEDRPAYIESLVELVFGHTFMKKTMLFKMYDSDGSTKLCLNTLKSMRLGPQRMGMILKIESKCVYIYMYKGGRRQG